MRLIFRTIGFIWRLFWRLVSLAVLILLLFLGAMYLRSSSGQAQVAANPVTNLVYQASDKFQQLIGSTDLKGLTDSLSDEGHVHSQGGRWKTARASIYIETQDPTLRQAYIEAIQHWNDTGAFTFELVNQAEGANIVATAMNDSSITAAGLAESEVNLLTKHFSRVTVKLNQHYLENPDYGYTFERIVNTAEHELGHAIGLDHNEAISVMQSSGSYYGIQPEDIAAVQALYATF